MISECCRVKVFKARSAGGWYINGELVHEWYECSQCKSACDTISTLTNKDDDNDSEGNQAASDNPVSPTEQSGQDPVCEEAQGDTVAGGLHIPRPLERAEG